MKKDHFVIAIERQYGSGGRIVGKMLAQELGIASDPSMHKCPRAKRDTYLNEYRTKKV